MKVDQKINYVLPSVNKTEDPSVQAAGSDYKCYHYPIRLQMLELPCLKKSKES